MSVNLALLRRVQGFAWHRFFHVAKWALLAYVITAGMIEYAFLQDHLSGGALVILTLSLVVYAVQVPTLDRVHRRPVRRPPTRSTPEASRGLRLDLAPTRP